MKINRFLGGSRFRATALLSPALAALLLSRPCMAQTNLTGSSGSVTNAYPYQLPVPSDFQRLQYYYAAYSSSPAPGTELGIFTLQANNVWSGDWNSSIVPAPTRTQLNALTPQQVDIFRRAGVYTNGSWQIVTSATNTPLSSLSLTPSSYAQIRATADRDRVLQQYSQFLQSTGATSLAVSP